MRSFLTRNREVLLAYAGLGAVGLVGWAGYLWSFAG